jgi:hypothetical protein
MSDSPGSDDVECPQCHRTLPVSEFHSNVRRPTGRAFYCKQCANERSEASRRKRGVNEKRRPQVSVPAGSKWCPDCETVKPLEEFARTKASSSGYHSYCRPCHNARGKETAQRLYGGSGEYHLRRRYGIGMAEFDEILTIAGPGLRDLRG